MRVVIDPNVYISATLSPSGAPAQLLRRWRLRQFDMIVSTTLIEELDRTLRRDRFRPYVTLDDVDDFIDELRHRAEPAHDPGHPAPISRDPDDDYLIALALEADADALVSGDLDLTDLDDPPVHILTPRALLDKLTAGT